MRLQRQTAVASAALAVVSASPIELTPRAGLTFTIDQNVPKPFILSGPSSMLKTYNKFGKPAPADVQSAAANNDGTVTATPQVRSSFASVYCKMIDMAFQQYDEEYLCPVTLGGQTLKYV